MEHRWGNRRRVILRVRLCGSGQTATTGWLTNISVSGAYVRTLWGPAVMRQITIGVHQQNDGDAALRSLQLVGRVVRHGRTGIGIEWEELVPGMLAEIVAITTSRRQARATPTQELQAHGIYRSANDERRRIAP